MPPLHGTRNDRTFGVLFPMDDDMAGGLSRCSAPAARCCGSSCSRTCGASGRQIGAAFPGELALVAEYRVTGRPCARLCASCASTVSSWPAADANRGCSMEIEQPVGALYSLSGQEQRSIVHILDIRADGVVAARLGLEVRRRCVYLERLRLAGGEPLAVEPVLGSAHLAAPLLDATSPTPPSAPSTAAAAGSRSPADGRTSAPSGAHARGAGCSGSAPTLPRSPSTGSASSTTGRSSGTP